MKRSLSEMLMSLIPSGGSDMQGRFMNQLPRSSVSDQFGQSLQKRGLINNFMSNGLEPVPMPTNQLPYHRDDALAGFEPVPMPTNQLPRSSVSDQFGRRLLRDALRTSPLAFGKRGI